MRSTTKVSFMKRETYEVLFVIAFIVGSVIAGAMLSYDEPYIQIEVNQ